MLDHRPIRARRPTLWSRFAMWCQHLERIREAGAFLFFLGVVFLVWCVLGLVVVALGIQNPGRPGQFIWHVLRCMGFYALMVWVGRNAMRRKLAALWAGAVLAVIAQGVLFAFQLFPDAFDTGGIYSGADPVLMLFFHLLFQMLAAVWLVAFVVALRAYYANASLFRRSDRD